MSQIFNQYSAVWFAAGLLLVIVLFLFRHRPRPADFIALGAVVLGLGIAWNLLHPVQTPLMEDARSVQAMIGQGTPVLLEFQSPY